MSHTVQPSAPKDSQLAYYLLMGILGISFLAVFIWVAIAVFQ